MNIFHCVNCGHEAQQFKAKPVGSLGGSLTYVAECPRCGSTMVNAKPVIIEPPKVTITLG